MEMLTGFDFIEASHQRVAGYRASLERHGLPYDPDKVHFGNFWMNSGAELAESYIKKTDPFPKQCSAETITWLTVCWIPLQKRNLRAGSHYDHRL